MHPIKTALFFHTVGRVFLTIMIATTTIHAKDNLHIYEAYGNASRVIIEGRMLHERTPAPATPKDSIFKNFYQKTKEFFNDEIKDSIVYATLDGKSYQSKSDDEGYFHFDIQPETTLTEGYHDISLQIKDNPTKEQVKVPIMIAPAKGIISDFDDTIVISDVTKKWKLIYNILAKNYTQRTLIPTMKDRFVDILSQNPPKYPTPLFILTGSPTQLFGAMEQFLNFHHFPSYQLIAKQMHGAKSDPLLDQFAYKSAQIERLITLFPKMTWTLFGDSGEKDEEVYQTIAKKYPTHIDAIYIRDVTTQKIHQSPIPTLSQ